MTSEEKEKFTFAYDELKAFIALTYSKGVHDGAFANDFWKEGDGRKMLDKTVNEMIEMKRKNDSRTHSESP